MKITKLLNPLFCIVLDGEEIIRAYYNENKANEMCQKFINKTGDHLTVKKFTEMPRGLFANLMHNEMIK